MPLTYRHLTAGQPFSTLTEGTHADCLSFNRFAGRYVVICCFGSSVDPRGRAALEAVQTHAALFDDVKASFLGVGIDLADRKRLVETKGVSFAWDQDGAVSRDCGAAPREDVPLGRQYRVMWTILDPTLHVLASFCTGADSGSCDAVFAFLGGLPDAIDFGACEIPAPVLVLPNLFDSGFCDTLVGMYEAGTPRESGFMRRNAEVFDSSFKRRRDYFIDDPAMKERIRKRMTLCVTPEIRKLFFMQITHMERYLVGCYAAEDEAHFRPHRDNGQTSTAHRRFAVSVALNDDFEGGELMFPEYNQRRHRLPKGWALVFPCAAVHAVTRVTRGRRFAFLPFLYDDAGAAIKARFTAGAS